jgi:hemerythrin-like domain-containing protein
MARISDLTQYNDLRRIGSLSDSIQIVSNDFVKFTNSYGDDMVITPKELKEELHKFIDQELLSQTQEDIERKREYLKREIDKRLAEFETLMKRHIDDKIDKITETIIESALSRVVEERVNQRVNEKIKQIKKLLE